MSAAISITLSPEAEQIVRNMPTLPARMAAAIVSGMKEANKFAVAKIKAEHLTGQGPFPVEEHRLGNRTWRLRGSVWDSDPQDMGNGKIESAIGSNVSYAAIHEFGGRIHHPSREQTVRHRLDARGALMTQVVTRKNGKSFVGLIFARKSHKRVREMKVKAKAYDINMPERMPFRTGIAESQPTYRSLISAAIMAEWRRAV
jgi:hypothetical protein